MVCASGGCTENHKTDLAQGQYGGGYGYQQQQHQNVGPGFQQPPQQHQGVQQQPKPAAAPKPASELPKPIPTKEGGPKVLTIGGDTAKPKAKVLSIGVPAPPKETPKEADAKDAPKETPTKAEVGAKATAAKAIEKAGGEKISDSGKTSPTPSSGRSSPTRATSKVVRDADAVEKEQAADVDDETLKEVYGKEHVNIIFIGHVDAGKSTLGGSILYSTGMVDQRTLDKYKKEAKDLGRETWYVSSHA